MDDGDALLARIARLEAVVAQQAERIKELEAELRRRGKRFTPKANAKPSAAKSDRRTKPHRKHAGQARSELPSTEATVEHDVVVDTCPDCGGSMHPTGQFTDHVVEDIPEPKVEVHRYRRHVCRCEKCGVTAQGRSQWTFEVVPHTFSPGGPAVLVAPPQITGSACR